MYPSLMMVETRLFDSIVCGPGIPGIPLASMFLAGQDGGVEKRKI